MFTVIMFIYLFIFCQFFYYFVNINIDLINMNMNCLDIKVFYCNIVFIFKYLTVIIQCKVDCTICKFYFICFASILFIVYILIDTE